MSSACNFHQVLFLQRKISFALCLEEKNEETVEKKEEEKQRRKRREKNDSLLCRLNL